MKVKKLKPFVGVVGYANSGKSAVISSLTGCRNSTYRGLINNIQTNESILVYASSPQENPISKQEFIVSINSASMDPECRGVVCAIQPTKPRTRISIEDIYGEVVKNGKFKPFIFLLDPPRKKNTRQGGIFGNISSRTKSISIVKLNGEVFPYSNAEIIQNHTRIINSMQYGFFA